MRAQRAPERQKVEARSRLSSSPVTVVTGDAGGGSTLLEGIDARRSVIPRLLVEDSMLRRQVLGVQASLAGAPVLQHIQDQCALLRTCLHIHTG